MQIEKLDIQEKIYNQKYYRIYRKIINLCHFQKNWIGYSFLHNVDSLF